MNILFTSAGRRGYLLDYFRAANEGDGKIYAGSSYKFSPAFLHADAHVVTPLIYSPEYIEFIIDYCKKNDIKLVIPLFDLDIPVLAKSIEVFQKNKITVLAPDYTISRICNDKLATHEFLTANDIASPLTYSDLAKVKFSLISGEISYPLVIKPRWGMGSAGVEVVEDDSELDILYERVRRKTLSGYLMYESLIEPDSSVIIQEFIQGEEYGLDIVNDLNGKHVVTFSKHKIAMRAGETDIAETVNNPRLDDLGKKISLLTKHPGNMDVDVFISGDEIKVLELNARFGGGYPFSQLAGADLPRAILAWLKGRQPKSEWLKIEYGVTGSKNIVLDRLT